MNGMIRFASADDSASLLKIYAQYIDTPVTFEYELPTEAEFAERIRRISAEYPYLVWEESGVPRGYAYAHRHTERAAYQWNAELSVYVDSSFTSGGIGKRLYSVLLEILKRQGVRTVYAGVTLPNVKSEGLHRAFSFRRLGVYRRTGYKCGKWHDVAWFEKKLAPCTADPTPFLPIHRIPQRELQAITEPFSSNV